jgi:pre-60S factor REI1
MFIPEKEFLAQPEELIKHLHEKVHAYHECLKCHKILHTASGIQTHMRDRGYCMIAFDTDIELVEIGEFYEFYDFWSSYSDAANFDEMAEEAEDSDDSSSTTGGGIKLSARRETKNTTG